MQSIRTYVRTYIYICVCVHISTNKVPLYHTTLWLYVIYVSLEACDANNELCRLQTGSSFARVLWHWPDLTTPGGVLAADCQPVVDVDGTELRQSWRCGKRAIWCVAIRSSRSPVANWVSHWVPNDRSMVDLCCFVLLEGSSREEHASSTCDSSHLMYPQQGEAFPKVFADICGTPGCILVSGQANYIGLQRKESWAPSPRRQLVQLVTYYLPLGHRSLAEFQFSEAP